MIQSMRTDNLYLKAQVIVHKMLTNTREIQALPYHVTGKINQHIAIIDYFSS